MSKIEPINLSDIETSGGTQVRAEIDQATVKEYAEEAKAGAVFPPVVVYHDGATYWLADGFHRYWQAHQRGCEQIRAEIRQGSKRDAILHAVGANAEHGLRRSNEDKRRAVMTLLEDPEWWEWSNAEIAKTAQVDDKTVAKYREQLRNSEVEGVSEAQNGDSEKRKGADGKKRPASKKASKKKASKAKASGSGNGQAASGGSGSGASGGSEGASEGDGEPEASEAKDGTGDPVPYSDLVPIFEAANRWRSTAKQVKRMLDDIAAEAKQAHAQELELGNFKKASQTAVQCIKRAIPHAPHHACKGAGCEWCEGRGWLTKNEHRREQKDVEAAAQ